MEPEKDLKPDMGGSRRKKQQQRRRDRETSVGNPVGTPWAGVLHLTEHRQHHRQK